MSSLFSGSSGGLFGSGASAPAAPLKTPGRSLIGTVVHDALAIPEHLITDVGSAAVNLPVGLYTIGKTAVLRPDQLPEIAKGIVKQYEAYYGHDVLHHLYEHPLQPILDGLTLASGGLGAAAKLGTLADVERFANLAKRSELITRSPGGGGPDIVKLTSNRPITKVRQLATRRVAQAVDDFVQARNGIRPLDARRYGKTIQAHQTQLAIGRSDLVRPYEAIVKKLSPEEKIALNARSLDIHPDDLSEFWAHMGDTQNAADIARPGVRDLILNPNEKMQAAEPLWRGLSREGAGLLKQRGALSAESELDRPGRFKEQASQMLGRPVREVHGDPYYIPHTTLGEKGGSHPLAMVGGGKAEPRDLGTTKQNFGELFRQGKLDLQSDVLGPEFLRRVKWLKFWGVHQGLKRGALRVTWDELHSMNPSGRPPKGWDFLRTSVPTRESQKLAKRISSLEKLQGRNPSATRAEALQRLYDRHSKLVLGEEPDPYIGLTKQKIPFSIRSEGEHTMKKLIPNPEDLQSSTLSEGFTTQHLKDAYQDESQRYYLVPKATARAATGEFTRMGKFMYVMHKYPLRVWRSLLLGLRPAFLVNNLIGNSLMYAMKTGGTGAVRDLFQAIRETSGDSVARRLLDDPAAADHKEDLLREFYPEQMSGGTLGRTQSPAAEGLLRSAHTRGGKIFETTTGAIPRWTAKIAEERLRRALLRNFIRRSPEFKSIYSALPRDTRTFDAAVRKLHEGKGGPAYQRMISEQVDHSLGNYTQLSSLERNVLRNVFPFYAWYRAILNTTLHLGLDNPLRANLLFRLGQVGAESALQQLGGLALPSYLQGALPLGEGPGGTQRLIATQSLNPWATIEQLGRGITTDWTQLGINPFVEGAAQALVQLSSKPGASKAVSPGSVFADMLKTTGMGLPPMAQVFPSGASQLYPLRGSGDFFAGVPVLGKREAALEGWLGAPIKNVDPFVAASRAAAGQ